MNLLKKYIDKIYIIAIGVLILLLLQVYTSWRKTIAENKTLQKAIENPAVIEKQKIVYRQSPPKIITRTVVVNADGTTTTTEREEYNGDTVDVFIDEGSEKKPVVPEMPKQPVSRYSLIGTYSIEQTWSVGVTYRIIKSIPLDVGAGYHSDDKIQGVVAIRF